MQSKRIVLTGGIATGKSTAARFLQELGYPVIDADRIAHGLIEPGAPAYQEVVDAFGSAIQQEDGTINRKALGAIVFSDERQRTRLNGIMHPHVRAQMDAELKTLRDEPLVFLDIPLYYEAEHMPALPVWLIYAPKDVQLQRLLKRDALTQREAHARITAQMEIETKRMLADRVFVNTGTTEELKQQLLAAVQECRSDRG